VHSWLLGLQAFSKLDNISQFVPCTQTDQTRTPGSRRFLVPGGSYLLVEDLRYWMILKTCCPLRQNDAVVSLGEDSKVPGRLGSEANPESQARTRGTRYRAARTLVRRRTMCAKVNSQT
jgi:hypothetical protein